ncbi:hypothetical protein EVAR_92835_1 [Eumeta japonica]|uniref:DUF4371 domain-containing protein n=1 Tax=Eumeta variegata TaxID=151549 RepID=A0A4C1TAZ6_EUMVA|nr:hypothetical protein EVAR_92835_1 [Eumeta japonica]
MDMDLQRQKHIRFQYNHFLLESIRCFQQGSFGKQDEGFNDRWNASIRLERHENSREHKTGALSLQSRSDIIGRADHELAARFSEELTYWREVLKRVVASVKFLASHGLPFRGHYEKLGSLHNENYPMTLEPMAELYPFLSKRTAQYGGKGKRCTRSLKFYNM